MNDFRGYLMHYGVKGMHWGVRRYQNPDGSLTEAGRKHYGKSFMKAFKKEKTTYAQPLNVSEQFVKDVTEDLQKLVSKDKIKTLLSKKKKMDDLYKEGMDAEDKFYDEVRDKAYNKTINYFKKHDPEYLNEIIKNNNGNVKDLDAFHDFRKMLDGYQDEIMDVEVKRPTAMIRAERAFNDFYKYRNELAKEALGVFANRKIKDIEMFYVLGNSIDYDTLLKSIEDDVIIK